MASIKDTVSAFGAARRRSYFYVALPVLILVVAVIGLAALAPWLPIGRSLIRPFV